MPNLDGLKEKSVDLGEKVLDILEAKPQVYGPLGAKFRELVLDLKMNLLSEEWKEVMDYLCDQFFIILSEEKYTMPSSLLNTALKVADDILTTYEKRKFICDRVQQLFTCDSSVVDNFLCEFVITVAEELVIFTSRCLRNHCDSVTTDCEIVIDQEQRESLYYIAGSIVHTMRLYGKRFPGNPKWKKIVEVIDTKILEDDFWESLSTQQQQDRQWTEKRNRGGLKFVKEKFQSFIVSLAKFIIKNKNADGSFNVEEMLEKVVVSPVKFEWDSAIGSSLDQDCSLTFMAGVTKKLITTYGNGIVHKYLNSMNENTSTVAVPLRHSVISTKV